MKSTLDPDMYHPRIQDVINQDPGYSYSQSDLKKFSASFFEGKLDGLSRLLDVFDNSEIAQRRLCMPLEWFTEERSFQEKNDTFIKRATELTSTAVTDLLQRNELSTNDIDYILFVCTTGLATPSIDARLINSINLSPKVKRIPIWGLGCAGGVLGLMQAADILRGAPGKRALLVNVELCSLTFHFHDFSVSNFVATALFADGVTVALINGADIASGGLHIMEGDSHTWPDSLDVMGWNLQNEGMQVVFAQSIPELTRTKTRPVVDEFLQSQKLKLKDINHYLLHPGGKKVLEAYESAFDRNSDTFANSAKALSDFGNCSSASVMQVIETFLRKKHYSPGDLALVGALGPGFTLGQVLLRC